MSDEVRDPWQLVKEGYYQQATEIYAKLYSKDGRISHLYNSGLAKILIGDYTAALNDFKIIQETREASSLSDNYYIFQGVCHWYLNSPDKAIDAWQISLTAPYTDAAGGVESPALLLYAAERLNDKQLRKRALSLLRKHYRRKLDNWPGAIVPFLLGKINRSDLENAAKAATHENLGKRWQCQANFYIALQGLINGDNAAFRTSMELCSESKHGYLEQEYYLARWETQHNYPVSAFVK